MGKWTPTCYDDILAGKIKSLVAGAIKRTKLEKTEPTITYEAFVEDLDGGDSFTTSLIEILVKELAERRTRSSSADRRLIADSSAKSLRMLATPLRIYRDRSGRGAPGRRSTNLTDYLSAPPEEMDMDEDDEEFESMLGNAAASTAEGARVNSEVYDAYNGDAQRWTRAATIIRRSHPSYSTATAATGSDEPHTVHDFLSRSHSPPIPSSRSGPWTLPVSSTNTSGSSLFRQPSIRRPVRSRTVDFNEFTSNRRSTIRQNVAQESLASRPEAVVDRRSRSRSPDHDNRSAPVIIRTSRSRSRSPDNGSPQLIRESSRSRSPAQDEPPAIIRAPQSARRFFPFSRNRRHESTVGSAWTTDASGAEPPDELSSYMVVEPREFGPWFSLASSSSSSQPDAPDAESDQNAQPVALRLRRGGVRAPESMLSRHASPSVVENDASAPPSIIRPIVSNEDGRAEEVTYPSLSQHESSTGL